MTQVVSQSLANAVYLTKHDGNGDNRYAIIIQGGKGDHPFEQNQYRINVQEMARILTEHPESKKPGPGYTGYYLQDHIYYVGVHGNIPEVIRDKKIQRSSNSVFTNGDPNSQGKTEIFNAIKRVATLSDSYDNVLFFYTSHGGWRRVYDPFSKEYVFTFYFDANDHHLFYDRTYMYQEMKMKYSSGDISTYELAKNLNKITCNKMIIILQPCWGGNWLDALSNNKNEKNRIIIVGERTASYNKNTGTIQSRLTLFDKCNFEIDDSDNYYLYRDRHTIWYEKEGSTPHPRYYKKDPVDPKGDGEKYHTGTKPTDPGWEDAYTISKCTVTDKSGSTQDGIFEMDYDYSSYDFLENPNDNGVELISGITEAYYIDRDYYRLSGTHHSSNNNLDADESGESNRDESIVGNSNEYVSIKESYHFMRFWHLGCHMKDNGGNPDADWYDGPQIRYTHLEQGSTYLI